MKASDVYKLVSSRLQDLASPQRWPWTAPATDADVSLQVFLNNALLTLALQRPDATAVTKDFTLVAGPLQSLGATDLFLLDCLYTLDSDDAPERVITRINKQDIDGYSLSWPVTDGDIYNWAYERIETPRQFWVIPGAVADKKIKVIMSEYPVSVTLPTTELVITPLYLPALAEMVLYQVFASDTEDANWQKAMGCLQTAAQIMGVKIDIDANAPLKTKKSEGV